METVENRRFHRDLEASVSTTPRLGTLNKIETYFSVFFYRVVLRVNRNSIIDVSRFLLQLKSTRYNGKKIGIDDDYN